MVWERILGRRMFVRGSTEENTDELLIAHGIERNFKLLNLSVRVSEIGERRPDCGWNGCVDSSEAGILRRFRLYHRRRGFQ